MDNLTFAGKLPLHKEPEPVTYLMNDNIFIDIVLVTGYFCVEGDLKLYDDLFQYRGLDKKDLENFYLVSKYIQCTDRQK